MTPRADIPVVTRQDKSTYIIAKGVHTMGMGPIRCALGFSPTYTNELSERLEQRASELDQRFRKAQAEFQNGISSLHDSVDSALCNDRAKTVSCLNRGLAELSECNANLSGMVDNLASTRADLATCREVDPNDPLNLRERFFSLIDWDQLYGDLVTNGAALPRRVFWDEVVSAIQSGGAQGALRLLESQLKDLQTNLCTYIGEVESMRNLPMEKLSHSLHETNLSVSALVVGLVQFLISCTYVSIGCGHAMHLCEQDLALAVAAG